MTYWCPIAQDYTDPPRLKRTGKRSAHRKTHVLHEGKALCGKPSPAFFHYPDEKPTCRDCLIRMDQLKWFER